MTSCISRWPASAAGVAGRAGRLRIAQIVAALTRPRKCVHGADKKMRLNSSVMLLDHQRSGDGKLVDGNENAQRDRNHKRRSAYDPANQAIVS